ncbi:MAG: hypothetical protein ACHQQ3_11735 [Gemmatimonadales bacterium]
MTDELDPERVRRLLDAAAALPRSIAPERDAWPAIRDRIEAQRIRPITVPANGPASGRSRRIAWIAAAAVLLVTVSSVVTVLVVRGGAPPQVVSVPPATTRGMVDSSRAAPAQLTPVAPPNPGVRAVSSDAPLNPAFARYAAAAADLATELERRRARLDPRTVAVLDSCLRRIDAAIAEARNALRQDPQNAVITELLTASYSLKLDLLKRAADLPIASLQD